MLKERIKELAIKNGFQDAREIGYFKDYLVYAPVFTDKKTRIIGYPQYILVRNEEIEFKIDNSFEITKAVFSD